MKIMLIGDSRVQGFGRLFKSYRYDLWKNLVKIGWQFDFIGPITDCDPYDDFMGLKFPRKHFGVAGYTTTDTLTNLQYALSVSPIADMALVGLGINNLFQDYPIEKSIEELSQIVDTLRALNKSITIFVEQVPPARSDTMEKDFAERLDEYNKRVKAMAEEKNMAESPIVPVDMQTDFHDSYFADNAHYNAKGAKEVADRYFAAMQGLVKTDAK